jgi:hypothetical protein
MPVDVAYFRAQGRHGKRNAHSGSAAAETIRHPGRPVWQADLNAAADAHAASARNMIE